MGRPVAAQPAAGFADALVVGGLSIPTGVAPLPDGSLVITEKGGALKLFDGATTSVLATVPVCSGSEMGLLDVVADPDFGTNGYLYLYRTENTGGCGSAIGRSNEVVRVTLAGGTVNLASLTVLLTGIQTDLGNHDGGGLRIGADGTLYVAIGDTGVGDQVAPGNSTNPYAQDLTSLNGKILRINRDGTVPADNPFVGQPPKRPEIYAYGFRNPWRFGIDPATGRLWVGDVGDLTVEEVTIVSPGGENHGWPSCEGDLPAGCPLAGQVAPVFTYLHSAGLGVSVTGGTFGGSALGAFAGDYFFGDFGGNRVYRLRPNAARDGITGGLDTVVSGVGGPVDFVTGAGGAIYYVAITSGQVRRLTAALDAPNLLTGKKLVLKDNVDPARKGFSVLSKDPVAFPAVDPTVGGATIRVKGATFDDTYTLPASGWLPIGHPEDQKGFKYKDAALANGPVKTAQIKAGKLLKAVAKGAALGHALASDPTPVDVEVRVGTTDPTRYCLRFGGVATFKPGKQLTAKDAPTAPGCP